MTEENSAQDVAIDCECKLTDLHKKKDGTYVSFVLHPQDPGLAAISNLNIGQRFGMALVPLTDDGEEPDKLRKKPEKKAPAAKPLHYAQEAAILGADESFRTFLRTQGLVPEGFDHPDTPHTTRDIILAICNTDSRAKLLPNTEPGNRWRDLKATYDVWKQART